MNDDTPIIPVRQIGADVFRHTAEIAGARDAMDAYKRSLTMLVSRLIRDSGALYSGATISVEILECENVADSVSPMYSGRLRVFFRGVYTDYHFSGRVAETTAVSRLNERR